MYKIIFLSIMTVNICTGENILMITLAATKSHKIPFEALAKGLIHHGHSVTFINAFPSDSYVPGLQEMTPSNLVYYVKNVTNWDLVGRRMNGENNLRLSEIAYYITEICDILLRGKETKYFLENNHKFDLIILDGAFPECGLGFVHHFKSPFMYINTVAFYSVHLSLAGNPISYAVTPFSTLPYTDKMSLYQRIKNTMKHLALHGLHYAAIDWLLQNTLQKHFGKDIPSVYEMSKNVSFILHNGYAPITYPAPYLPNVAEIACIHCRMAKPLSLDLEEFIQSSGDAGFVYFSMGSSVKANNMPDGLKQMLLTVFKCLPYKILWKYETDDDIIDLPNNVKLGRWFPQQDILGHPKLKAFITHGGLLSMFETIYHGIPVITIPICFDHNSNSAKAENDGYALKLDLQTLTAKKFLWAINEIIHNSKYKENVKKMQRFLLDQSETPLQRAVYWTEYVLRHKGADHLQSPAKHLGIVQYYLIDVFFVFIFGITLVYFLLKHIFYLLKWYFFYSSQQKKSKLD